jgi:hypothetical protein
MNINTFNMRDSPAATAAARPRDSGTVDRTLCLQPQNIYFLHELAIQTVGSGPQ